MYKLLICLIALLLTGCNTKAVEIETNTTAESSTSESIIKEPSEFKVDEPGKNSDLLKNKYQSSNIILELDKDGNFKLSNEDNDNDFIKGKYELLTGKEAREEVEFRASRLSAKERDTLFTDSEEGKYVCFCYDITESSEVLDEEHHCLYGHLKEDGSILNVTDAQESISYKFKASDDSKIMLEENTVIDVATTAKDTETSAEKETKSTKAVIADTGPRDILSYYNYSYGDIELKFDNYGEFEWYKSGTLKNKGTYIVNLNEYAIPEIDKALDTVTAEDLENLLDSDAEANVVCLCLTEEDGNHYCYYGFLKKDFSELDVVNAQTDKSYLFILDSK